MVSFQEQRDDVFVAMCISQLEELHELKDEIITSDCGGEYDGK